MSSLTRIRTFPRYPWHGSGGAGGEPADGRGPEVFQNKASAFPGHFPVQGIKRPERRDHGNEKPIRLTISIPEELRKDGRTFVIYREHNGVVELLKDLDNDPATVTIESDQFSVSLSPTATDSRSLLW